MAERLTSMEVIEHMEVTKAADLTLTEFLMFIYRVCTGHELMRK